MTVRIIHADVREGLRSLPDESVHCVVTSPPYWGLRDYGEPGQIGLEPTLGEHLATLVEVFREVRRVLRADGTLWLNYGDCYASTVNGRSAAATKAAGNDDRTFRDKPFATIGPISPGGAMLKPKDLCLVPHRLAIALHEDGWYIRNDNVWAKPNPMPESVIDRCTKAHEYVFLLTRSESYFFNVEAIKEPAEYADSGRTTATKSDLKPSSKRNGRDGMAASFRAITETRLKRSVWTIPTSPYEEAHFATFPPELVEICLLAGCPPGGIVLDPFGGSGTVGLVAKNMIPERDAILIDLSAKYCAMADNRVHGSLFAEGKIETAAS